MHRVICLRTPKPLQSRFILSSNQVRGISIGNDTPRTRFVSLTVPEKDDECHLRTILGNNKKWVADMKTQDAKYFEKLSKPQKPKYLYIGCADSRVPANEILGLGAGEVFVHRNVGNMIPGNDLNALSVLEFAVTNLDVTDIIVTGHYDCGAIRAATKRQDLGLLENWLRQIRDVYRLHQPFLDQYTEENDRHLALVELNVVEQCLNIFKTGVVQRKRNTVREALKRMLPPDSDAKVNQEDIFPRIHGLVFNPADGILKKLPVNFKKYIGPLDHIYGLIPKKKKVEKVEKGEKGEKV